MEIMYQDESRSTSIWTWVRAWGLVGNNWGVNPKHFEDYQVFMRYEVMWYIYASEAQTVRYIHVPVHLKELTWFPAWASFHPGRWNCERFCRTWALTPPPAQSPESLLLAQPALLWSKLACLSLRSRFSLPSLFSLSLPPSSTNWRS